MAVYIKSGGAWRQCGDGRLYIKWGGSWRLANYCYIRAGGVWRDSGYRSYPNAPQGIRVASWDFGQVTPYWDAPAGGGAPVSYYHVVKTDANGNWVAQVNTGAQQYSFGVSQDERCQFYVRSIGPSGLASAFNGPLRCQIGHTETGYTQSEARTRQWESPLVEVNLYNGASAGPQVPSTVTGVRMYVNLHNNEIGWAYHSPGTNRAMYYIVRGQVFGGVLTLANPSNGWLEFNNPGGNGGDSGWGLYATGSGYSAGPTGSYRVWGNLKVYGTETYYENVYYQTRAYAGNSYW